jgi:hypothetical protein
MIDRDGWFTSSFTNASGACVEVKFGDHAVLVRDTKKRQDGMITVGPAAWTTFLNNLTEIQ